MKRGAGIALLCLAVMAASAAGKGLDLSLRADERHPIVGQQVEIGLRGVADEPMAQPCRRMRVVVVAPGVSVKRARAPSRVESSRAGSAGGEPSASPRCDRSAS